MNKYKNNLTTLKQVDIRKRCGDGAVIVRRKNGRTATIILFVRTAASKAGGKSARRGSDVETLQTQPKISINMKAISNIKNLVAAYETIKSNPGDMTPGWDSISLDGIYMEYLNKIQKELKVGTFIFSTARRVHKPKPGKSETRPLTIASPREKIIQKALHQAIEPVYETEFLESSHGFRPGRGRRTAIKYLESKFQNIKFIIEADFSKAFDKIPHDKLMELLKRKISCDKTVTLIKSGLKAGFADNNKLYEQYDVGIPQGSILSPLLCNIYLHELDQFIEVLKKTHYKGKWKAKSSEYMSLANKVKY